MSESKYKKFITESTTWDSLKPSQKKAIQSLLMSNLIKKIDIFEMKDGKIIGGLYKPDGIYLNKNESLNDYQYPYNLYISHFNLSKEFQDKIQEGIDDTFLYFSESKIFYVLSRFIADMNHISNLNKIAMDALNDMVDSIFILNPGKSSHEYKKPIHTKSSIADLNNDTICLNVDGMKWEWKHTSKQRRKIMFYNFFTRSKYLGDRQTKSFLYNLFISTREYLKGHIKVSKEFADKLDVTDRKRILLIPKVINFNEDHVELNISPYLNGCIQKRIIMKVPYDDYLNNKINDLDAIHDYDYTIDIDNFADQKILLKDSLVSTMTPFVTINHLSYAYSINFNMSNKKIVINHTTIPVTLSKLIKKSMIHKIYDWDIKKYFNNYSIPDVLYALRLSSYHTKYNSYYDIAKYHQYNPEIMRNRIQFMLRYPLIASANYNERMKNNGLPLSNLKLVTLNNILSKIDRGESYASDIKSLGYSKHIVNEIFTKPWQAFSKSYIELLNYHIDPSILNVVIENFDKWSKTNPDIKDAFKKIHHIKDNPFIFRNPIKYSHIKETSLQTISNMHDLYNVYQSLFSINYIHKQNGVNIKIAYDMTYNNISRKEINENFEVIGNSKFGIFESYEDFFKCAERYHNAFNQEDGGISVHIQNAIESARCHYKNHNKTEQKEVDLNEWPNFFGNYIHELGTLTFIENGNDLINEGKIMKHCVGGYINIASSASSFIAHIQSGEHHSTVELKSEVNRGSEITEKLNLITIQNRSYHNDMPHKNCEIILNSFLNHINKKSDVEKQVIMEEIIKRTDIYRNNQRHNRYYSSMALFFAMPYIKDILPRKYRKKDFQVLRDMIDYSDIDNNIVHSCDRYYPYPQGDF